MTYPVGTKVKSKITGRVGEIVRVFYKAQVYEVLITEPDTVPFMRLSVFDDVEGVVEQSTEEPTNPGIYRLVYADDSVEYAKKNKAGFYYVLGSDRAYKWSSFSLVKRWVRLD